MKNKIIVEINVPIEDTLLAMGLIDKFLVKNNITMKLSIAYDFELDCCGMYLPEEKGQEFRIFINPLKCKRFEEIEKQDWTEPYSPFSPCDITGFGVVIHEFTHLLQYRYFKNIIPDFIREFPENRFYLNNYSNHEICDELAEIMTLMITNPYLLKLISKEHFDFCKRHFKSPVICNSKKCFTMYESFPIQVKENLIKKWGIVYDYQKKDFVRN